MNKSFKIGNREVGWGKPTFVIAEIGINYNGDLEIAKKLIDAAKKAGCDVAKFQSWLPSSLYNRKDKNYQEVESELFRREDHQKMMDYCQKKGILFMSSAFSEEDIDFLESLNVPAHKIASCELNNIPLLKKFARTGKPLILSTGFGNRGEIKDALETIKAEGNEKVVLLHCISAYPPKVEEMNLRFMNKIAQEFKVPVGLSDHSIDLRIPLAAVARGACVVERHITLDRNMVGFDHKASTQPEEFKEMIEGFRIIEKALGNGQRKIQGMEAELSKFMKRSILAGQDIQKGELITEKMLAYKRPGEGLSLKEMPKLVGKKAKRNIAEGEYVKHEDVA